MVTETLGFVCNFALSSASMQLNVTPSCQSANCTGKFVTGKQCLLFTNPQFACP